MSFCVFLNSFSERRKHRRLGRLFFRWKALFGSLLIFTPILSLLLSLHNLFAAGRNLIKGIRAWIPAWAVILIYNNAPIIITYIYIWWLIKILRTRAWIRLQRTQRRANHLKCISPWKGFNRNFYMSGILTWV